MSAPLAHAAMAALNVVRRSAPGRADYDRAIDNLAACLDRLRGVELAYAEIVADAAEDAARLDLAGHLAAGGARQ
jgi:hypothetical protein